jgi:hypothetical protein
MANAAGPGATVACYLVSVFWLLRHPPARLSTQPEAEVPAASTAAVTPPAEATSTEGTRSQGGENDVSAAAMDQQPAEPTYIEAGRDNIPSSPAATLPPYYMTQESLAGAPPSLATGSPELSKSGTSAMPHAAGRIVPPAPTEPGTSGIQSVEQHTNLATSTKKKSRERPPRQRAAAPPAPAAQTPSAAPSESASPLGTLY